MTRHRLSNALPEWLTDRRASLAKRSCRVVQVLIALPALLLLGAFSIPALRAQLESIGLVDAMSVLPLLGVLLAVAVSALDDIFKAVSTSATEIKRITPASSLIIRGGKAEVFEKLGPMLSNLKGSRKTLDVLGLTLFTAWPQLKSFLENTDADGWKIRLLCIDPSFRLRASDLDAACPIPGLSAGWLDEAASYMSEIKEYVQTHRERLAERRISIGVYGYKAFPAIHGFRLGDGALIMSWSHWDRSELSKPNHFYELFPSTDHSARANEFRKLFDNWFDHALTTAKQPAKAAA
jgi:hypothetical protein